MAATTVFANTPSQWATAYSSQRHLDRTSNGVLWAVHHDGTNNYIIRARYSTDNGATWASATNPVVAASAGSVISNSSFFIDANDFAHLVYRDAHDGFLYYLRGVPNAARTAWTWAARHTIWNVNQSLDHPDVVAFAKPDGTGWKVFVVAAHDSASNSHARWLSLDLNTSGVVSATSTGGNISTVWSASHRTWPSIDFRHTGDGKTVQAGTPHLYVAWSGPSGSGVMFEKANYSNGSWTWAGQRTIDSSQYVQSTNQWLNCLYDGSRVIIAGCMSKGEVTIWERNEADTTTTTRLVVPFTQSNILVAGSATYDMYGNVYLFGRKNDESTGTYDAVYRRWVRDGALLSGQHVIDSGVGQTPHVSAKRGASSKYVEFIWTDNAASPYNVMYDGISLNTAPGAPGAFSSPTSGEDVDKTDTVAVAAASDPEGDALTYEWDLSLDNGATYTRKRNRVAGTSWTYDYTNDPATTAAKWRVRAYDGQLYGPYSYSPLFTVQHNKAPTAPTPTEPVGNAVKNRTQKITLKATFNDPDANDSVSESRWRTRVVGTTTWDEIIQSGNMREYSYAAGHFAANQFEWQALYKDAGGLASPWSASEFFTAATPPAGPSITSPADGANVPQNTVVAWTSTNQAAFRIRRVADNAGAPDETTVYYDSGRIAQAGARNHPLTFETNERYEHIQIQVESAEGLLSPWVSVRVLVSYTPPRTPTLDVVAESADAQIRVAIRNLVPSNLLPTDAAASFEDGTTGGWNGANGATVAPSTAQSQDGARALAVTTPGTVHREGASSPRVAVNASATYTSSMGVYAPAGATLYALQIEFDGAGAYVGQGLVAFTGTGAWQELVVTRTTGSTTSQVHVEVRTADNAPQALTFYVDAVQVEPGAEATPFHRPSTPAVLSNDLWRREAGAGNGKRIGTNLEPQDVFIDADPFPEVEYEYRAVAIGDNDTTAEGDWTP